MATLVSLNFGHYFLKEGVYTMIGAETAQGLPNTQIYYSFIRGAGKQYGVPWFGNASVWNRWGWKNYSGVTDYNGGDTKGTSLSLLKRLIYSHIMYNCVAVGFESSFLNGKDELSPVGKIQQSANRWVSEERESGKSVHSGCCDARLLLRMVISQDISILTISIRYGATFHMMKVIILQMAY